MKIIDEEGREVQEENVDLSLGYLKYEKTILEEVPAVSHLGVKTFYFDDHTSYTVTGEDDPHIQIINLEKGIFKYIPQGEEKEKTLRGMDIVRIIDKEAYTRYEEVKRYILYTQDELKQRALVPRMAEVENKLSITEENLENLENQDLPNRISNAEESLTTLENQDLPNRVSDAEQNLEDMGLNIEDLILLFAEVLGGEDISEEESSEDIPEEEIPEETSSEEDIPENIPEEEEVIENGI